MIHSTESSLESVDTEEVDVYVSLFMDAHTLTGPPLPPSTFITATVITVPESLYSCVYTVSK